MATYTVRQGDVLTEIARRAGFNDETVIWNHPSNEPLRRAGRGPALLAPGDQLFVPLRSEVKRRAFKPAANACRIVPGELTGTAGVYGAAAVFMRHTWGRP